MPYSYITLAQFLVALSARLQDSSNQFWSTSELTLYIQEALRTWNAMAAWYRSKFTFNTSVADPFYDLSTVAGTLIPYTVTGQDLFQQIEALLLEPVTAGTWSGSEQFTADDIATAIQNSRDQFLLETGLVLNHVDGVTGNILTGRFDMDDTVIDLRRAAYFDANGNFTLLWRSDEYELNAYMQNWSVDPGPPSVYSIVATPPVRVQIAPLPNIPGTLDLITVNAGATVDPTLAVPLGIPDDFAWVVKFGALSDLLSKDGPPADPFRAQYCDKRWEEGIQLARVSTSVLFAQIDGLSTHVSSVFDIDTNLVNWQNLPVTAPYAIGMAGMNLLVLAPSPDAGPHSVALDVLSNMPVPVNAGDFIQVGREELDVITDYAEHLAAFKMSGAEFMATMEGYQRMVRLAVQQNARWRAVSKMPGDDHNRARRDFSQVRRREHPEPDTASADMEGGV